MAFVGEAVIGGMTKAVVGPLLTNLFQEVYQIHAFQDDVEALKSEFDILQGFVQSAYYSNDNKMEGYVLKWIEKVENYVFQAERILNECSWWHLCNETTASSASSSTNVLRKARKAPSDLWRKWRISRRINSLTKELKLMRKLAIEHGLNGQHSQPPPTIEEEKTPSIIYDESFTVGLDAPVREFMSLVEAEQRIGVVGMGGLGKTRLLQHAFKEIKSRYSLSIWLCISQIYDIKSLQMDILHEIVHDKTAIEALWKVTSERRVERIHEILKETSCLIVLDDVWSSDPARIHGSKPEKGILEALGLPENVKVLLSTRQFEVVRDMRAYHYQMQHLSDENSKKLFCLYAGVNPDFDEQQEQRLLSIIKGCHNLPLALKTTARVLALHYQGNPARFPFPEEEGNDELPSDIRSDPVMRCLMRSYNALPMNLKQCFAYMSVFPEDHKINERKLVRLWMAERFVLSEQHGRKMVRQLCNRCLLEVLPVEWDDWFGSVNFKMHDLVRDLGISIFHNFGGFSKENVADLRRAMRHKKRVSLDKKMIPEMVPCGPQLRTLLLFPEAGGTIPTGMFNEAKTLRILDLGEGDALRIQPPKKKLKHLVLLHLYGGSGYSLRTRSSLPEWVKHLRSLEYLVTPYLSSIPVWLGELSRLTHLIMESDRFPYGMRGLRGLTNLRKLWFVQIDKINFTFRDLSNLLNLSDLKCNTTASSNMEEWNPSQNMQCLWLINKGEERDMPESWTAMVSIQCLRLTGVRLTISCLVFERLMHLVLEVYFGDPPPEIARLPRLTWLRLSYFMNCSELPEEYGMSWAFPSLEHFIILDFEWLGKLPGMERGAMRKLKSLTAVRCPDVISNALPTELSTRLSSATIFSADDTGAPDCKRWNFQEDSTARSYIFLDCGRHTIPGLLHYDGANGQQLPWSSRPT